MGGASVPAVSAPRGAGRGVAGEWGLLGWDRDVWLLHLPLSSGFIHAVSVPTSLHLPGWSSATPEEFSSF